MSDQRTESFTKPTKPCVICGGSGKEREKMTEAHRRNPRLKLKTVDCHWCGGTGKVFIQP